MEDIPAAAGGGCSGLALVLRCWCGLWVVGCVGSSADDRLPPGGMPVAVVGHSTVVVVVVVGKDVVVVDFASDLPRHCCGHWSSRP